MVSGWDFIIQQCRNACDGSCGISGTYKSSCHRCLVACKQAPDFCTVIFNCSWVTWVIFFVAEAGHNQAKWPKRKENTWAGSRRLMNEPRELDHAGSPEPALRLRKGHMSDPATAQDSSQHSLLLEEPPLSSDQENVSYMVGYLLRKMSFHVSASVF